MTSEKHRVLIFGEKVFGPSEPDLSIDYCDVVHLISFPSDYERLWHLVNYDLVILDYSAFFDDGKIYQREQEIFEKQMTYALEQGTCFCILHYDEDIPSESDKLSNADYGHMDRFGIAKCMDRQIGFRWLMKYEIRPYRKYVPIVTTTPKRNEFKLYGDGWGTSKNCFKPYGKV